MSAKSSKVVTNKKTSLTSKAKIGALTKVASSKINKPASKKLVLNKVSKDKKTVAKPAAKSTAKAVVKPAAKPPVKAKPKAAVKPAAKPPVKTAPVAKTKPAASSQKVTSKVVSRPAAAKSAVAGKPTAKPAVPTKPAAKTVAAPKPAAKSLPPVKPSVPAKPAAAPKPAQAPKPTAVAKPVAKPEARPAEKAPAAKPTAAKPPVSTAKPPSRPMPSSSSFRPSSSRYVVEPPKPKIPEKKPTGARSMTLNALKAFESAMKAFNRHNFTEAKEAFEQLLSRYAGEVEIAARVRTYLQICIQKVSQMTQPKSAPRNIDYLYNQGVFELNRGNTERAIEHFKQALKIQPEAHFVLYSLAAAHARRGELDDALANLRRAIELDKLQRNRLQARRDPDFAVLLENREFQQLVGIEVEQEPAPPTEPEPPQE